MVSDSNNRAVLGLLFVSCLLGIRLDVSGQALPAAGTASEANAPAQLGVVTVTASLDQAREEIAPSLGAVSYSIDSAQIQLMGQGEEAPFQQVLLQVPGMVMDEFGEVHIRGDHGDLQYRINGVLLPEGLNGFGQEIDSHLIQSVSVLTGTLPAQFGDRTAGIIDVTSKSGSQLSGRELSVYGGSYGTIQSTLQTGGSSGRLEYFLIVSEKSDNLGIDNTTNTAAPLHDGTNQQKAFGYFSYELDSTSRFTLLLSSSHSTFQIPDTPDLLPRYSLQGAHVPADSSTVNESQDEQNHYAVVSYQKSAGNMSLQLSAFGRYTDLDFKPDWVQDMIFGGVASQVDNSDIVEGLQADLSYAPGASHTLRAGFLTTSEDEKLDTNSLVFPVNSQGGQISDLPLEIADDSANRGTGFGLYLQDEWRLTDQITVNYGGRYDRFDASFDLESQFSPRANVVWTVDKNTTVHAGYSRYFMPPTLQYVHPTTIDKFEGTTNAPLNRLDDPQKVERDNYFDIGISSQIAPGWKVTVETFRKLARDLLDDGQFGSAVILNNFNYTEGTIYGAEVSSTFRKGPFSAYGNFSYVQTSAQNIDSVQFEFPSDELTYIAGHSIQLDHQGKYTGSGGAAVRTGRDTRAYADFLYGNGLRAGFANLGKLPAYGTENLGIEHIFRLSAGRLEEIRVRLDCTNILNENYEIRNGSGLGIAAPAYGARRAFYGGLTLVF